MARKHIKRSSIFTMIAVAALLSLGIGYAAWTDTLNVNGQVNTAAFDVKWTVDAIPTEDNSTDSDASTADPATCTAVPADNQAGTDDDAAAGDDDQLNVTLNEAYPGYTCTVHANIVNNSDLSVTADTDGLDSNGDFSFSASGVSISAISCVAANASLAAGSTTNCDFTIAVSDAAAPDSTITVSADVVFSAGS